MSYKLNHFEVSLLCQLNFDCSYYRSYHYYKTDYSTQEIFWENDTYIQSQKPLWNNLFLPLLNKQPELKEIIDTFWEQARKEKYIESLAGKIFNDKIEINNIYPLIFNSCSSYSGNSERKDFLKSIINHEPWIMNELHELLKHKSNAVLLATYIDLLPKFILEIKDIKQNIWKIVTKTKDFTESNCIKVLISSIKTFPKDEELYLFLKEHFETSFEQFHNLREKFNKYENKYFSNFKNNEVKDLFESEQEYVYIINIKDSVLIDHFKIDKNQVRDLKNNINDCLKNIIGINIGEHIYYNSSDKGFEIHSGKVDDNIKIEPLMKKIKEHLPSILQTLGNNYKTETLSDAFNSILLKLSLEKELPENYQSKIKNVKI